MRMISHQSGSSKRKRKMELVIKYNKIKKQSSQTKATHCHRAQPPPPYSNNWMAKNRIYTIIFQSSSSSAKRKTHRPKTNREGSQWDSTHTIFGQTEGPDKIWSIPNKKRKMRHTTCRRKMKRTLWKIYSRKQKEKIECNCFVLSRKFKEMWTVWNRIFKK